MNISREALNYLRKNTFLGPIARLKLEIERHNLIEGQKLANKLEHKETFGIDYDMLDEIEYEIRIRKWERQCAELWVKYSEDTIGLSEFSDMVLNQKLEENRLLLRQG